MKSCMLPQLDGQLKLMLNLFSILDIQGTELYLLDFIKCIFNTGLHRDTVN